MHSCALTRNLLVRSTAINKQDKLLNAPRKVGVIRGLINTFPRPNVYLRRIIYTMQLLRKLSWKFIAVSKFPQKQSIRNSLINNWQWYWCKGLSRFNIKPSTIKSKIMHDGLTLLSYSSTKSILHAICATLIKKRKCRYSKMFKRA